jgi:hypothetical protein
MAAILVLAALAAPPALARNGGRPLGGSPARPVEAVVPPAPMAPDTVVVRLAVPDSLPQPLAVHVVQDTLRFGGLLHLVLEYAPDAAVPPSPAVTTDADWLQAEVAAPPTLLDRLRGGAAPAVDLSGLPESAGPRSVASFRVYGRDPLRVNWHGQLSPVLVVAGRTTGTDETAGIRTPRALAWRPWQLVLAAAVLVALALLARWWWLRRHHPVPLAHWPLPEPAWLAAATGLAALLAADQLSRGETRLFLDRLAALARDYVAGRYRIAAREMTGREITRACAAQRFEPAHPAGYARLIDLADRERYSPEVPSPAFCREQAVQFFGRLNRTRLEVALVPVPAARLLAAQKAWASLIRELGPGAGRRVVAVGADQEGR